MLTTSAAPARILVVEDDVSIRQTLAELLEDEGFEVCCAANGLEALDRLTRSDVPSLILLDLAMPVMNGWEFRVAQREDPRLADIPTVVVSANHSADRRALEALAADAFLAKPFDLESLMSTIHRLC